MSISALSAMIGDCAEFLTAYWNKRPLVSRGTASSRFDSILTVDDLDRAVARDSIRRPYIRASLKGEAVSEHSYTHAQKIADSYVTGITDVDSLAHVFQRGGSIILDGIDLYTPRVEALCSRLSSELVALVEAVAFITPPDVQGLDVHFDNVEVFVLQLHGRKEWSVYEQVRPLAKSSKVLGQVPDSPPLITTVLWAGDCLYIPWGSPHHARSLSEMSCHLSVMVRPPTWGDILEDLLGAAVELESHCPVIPRMEADRGALIEQALQRASIALSGLEPDQLSRMLTRYLKEQARPPAKRPGFLERMAENMSLEADAAIFEARLPETQTEGNHE